MPRPGPNQYYAHAKAVQTLSSTTIPLPTWSQDAQIALLPFNQARLPHRFITMNLDRPTQELPAFRVVRDTVVTVQLTGELHTEYHIDGLDVRFKNHNTTQAVATFIANIFGRHTIFESRCDQPIAQINIL